MAGGDGETISCSYVRDVECLEVDTYEIDVALFVVGEVLEFPGIHHDPVVNAKGSRSVRSTVILWL